MNFWQKDNTIFLVPVLILLPLPLHQFRYPSFISSTCCVPHQLLQRKLMFLVFASATVDKEASREMKGLISTPSSVAPSLESFSDFIRGIPNFRDLYELAYHNWARQTHS
ncbi:hypothetical protein VNO77_04009 [Canavalia gladiata]|uniref:Uncharacterized protein n=1 Tax=Canavalia gladiata TaxID=3824 RepID=A0AAN9MWH0_CANGL